MRTRLIALLCVAALAACHSRSRQQQPSGPSRSDKLHRVRNALPGQYVVVVVDSVPTEQLADTAADLARRYKGSVLRVYGAALHGFALNIPSSSAPALAEEAVVRYVEEDGRMRIAGAVPPTSALRLAAAATAAPHAPTGSGATVYVLDTGIRADHSELAGRASAAWPDANVAPAAGDCNGHGTWVAALAGGSTFGVAPSASVRAVTVLGCDGAGAVSTVLAGLDWLARNHVASSVGLLSFSGPPSVSLDEGLRNVTAAGVPFVAAAGNSAADACDATPGRVASVLTLGATAASSAGSALPYVPLDLTNQGPCVDLFAHGDRVNSAWNVDASSTQAMSGTSAAAARAAGAAALFLEAHPGATAANVVDGITGTAKVGLIDGLAPGTPNRVLDPSAIHAGADAAAPTVSLPASLDGSIVSGAVVLSAIASDDVAVTQVAYYVDGLYVGASGASPWLAEWNTMLSGNGTHTVVARAYDAAGNVTSSAPATVTVENAGFATFDPARGVPACGVPLWVCDTGPLLAGRGPVGPERNAPNTIGGSCTDGAAGFFHLDESVEGIRIASLDGSPFTVGKGVEVQVKVWAYVDFTRDALDLYSAADAAKPSWRLLGTLVPADVGAGTLALRFTLSDGGVQALRAAFRYGGAAATCTEGLYDDRDDLVFAVAPGTADTSKPAVSIVAPAPGAVLGAATTLAAVATDDSGVVSRVDFLVDGTQVGTAWLPKKDTPDRFEVAWDAHTVADGTHTVVARATDGAGNVQDSSPVSFRVADLTPPSIELEAPVDGAALTGTVWVEAAASDDRGVTAVDFYAGTQLLGRATASPWKISWDTARVSGTVALTARAVDAAGNAATSAAVPVYVDHIAPTVRITSPQSGMFGFPTIVSGPVTIVADARDDYLLERVEYWVGTTLIGADSNAISGIPSSVVWNSGTFPNGFYDIVAKAYDAAGNMTASAPVTVWVLDTTAPVVKITAPADGASLRLVSSVTADVTDKDGIVAKVEFLLDGTVFSTDTSPPYAAPLDTTAVADGPHVLKVVAYDGAGNSASQQMSIQVDNTPPTVQLTAPLAPATISGTYTLKADAADLQAIDRVEFWVGGAMLKDVARQAPYQVDWDTTLYDNASFEVAAVAYDLAGNAATSGIVQVTVENSTTATYDTTLKAPTCAATGPFCFSATRLMSRSVIAPIAEPNEPNTLDGCKDGVAGAYGESESIESIKVWTRDGTTLTPGKLAQVDVWYYAYSKDFDRVDLFYAADAHAPAWTWFATLVPGADTSFQSGSAVVVLPSGPLQAVRAAMRYAESRSACAPGDFDDHDDLVFAVQTPGTDSTSPTVAITSPTNGGTVHGTVDVEVTATDNAGVARVELYDGAQLLGTLTLPPYGFVWDTTGLAGTRTLTAVAYDTSGNKKTSNPVSVTVDNTANAAYDTGLGAPVCSAVKSFCDPGWLLVGRDQLGPEVHTPNTLQASCPDGSWGTYGVEESVESIVVRTPDGSALTVGKPAQVDVTVIASAAYDADALELYEATDAEAPSWRHVTTLLPRVAGSQVLTAEYRLPPGALQALRARMRYRGVEEACGTYVDSRGVEYGVYDDHDDLAFAASGGGNATYDKTLKVPSCTGAVSYCDSGTLLDGRASLGPEPNQPNTLKGKCADGTAGVYHVDRSIDAIRVFTPGATTLATGKSVVIEVKVFASATAGDALDVYYTLDPTAGNPVWTHLTTLQPTKDGLQTLSTTVTLGSGSVQAVRATLRDGTATVGTCTTGSKDDHDDLAFAVAAGTPDTTKPDVRIVSPAPGTVLGTATTLAAVATDDSGVVSRVDFLVDGNAVGTTWLPKNGTLDRYEVSWDPHGVADGPHTLIARATDGAGNVGDSSPLSFWVSDVTPPTVSILFPMMYPEDGGEVTGEVAVALDAKDDRGVTAVELFVGAEYIGSDTASPWQIVWDTTSWDTGPVVLTARAFDAAGNSAWSAPLTVLVDHIPPTVGITAPSADAWLRGIATVSSAATDNDVVARVEFLVDGALFAVDESRQGPPSAAPLDTTTLADGAHVISVVAYDRAGNSTAKEVAVKVDNTPPTVRLDTPLAPGTISGSYTLEAEATDGQGVERVELWAGTILVGVVQAAPYVLTWDTTTFDNGSYDVEAVAYDLAGNTATSEIVQMKVDNSTTAVYDGTLHVPSCAATGPFCFSATELRSRARIGPVPEPNEPNTLDGCQDGTEGSYGESESIESIEVATLDGAPLTGGKLAQVDVRYYASSAGDRVDLFVAANAYSPSWTYFATIVPGATGLQSGSATFTLPSTSWFPWGPKVQAVRAAMRQSSEKRSACAQGPYDDHDDLAFAVATPGVDTTSPTAAITSPKNGGTVHGTVDVSVTATDDTAIARVELYDDLSPYVPLGRLTTAPYVFIWNTAGQDGLRTLTAVAYDTSGNKKTSNPVTVIVDNAADAAYDAALGAPACDEVRSFCDPGKLLAGRDHLYLGPEVNAPNTLRSSCPDGSLGKYGVDESVESIVLRTPDGSAFRTGGPVRVDVTVIASAAYAADALELYEAADAAAPVWVHLATVRPEKAGPQVLTATFDLPPGGLQALRARLRRDGVEEACGHGGYDDHDDLAFAVAP